MKKTVTVILGGQAGSEGKGKFAGYLALKDRPDAAVCNFMPNAGHTWVSEQGEKVMVQQLPQAVVNPTTDLYISAGSAIEPELLSDEIRKYGHSQFNLHIHPRAMIVGPRHREIEAAALNKISSTLKGCGAASAEKVMRTHGMEILAGGSILNVIERWVDHGFTENLHNIALGGGEILIEAPQGFDLDINHGLEYPYCTSRQTTTAQVLADAGMPPQSIKEVIAVIRPYPIRVGDAFDKVTGEKIGTSGTYLDSDEITWEEVARRGGFDPSLISEYTTVTKKLRRVFEINWRRLREMCAVNGVTQLALNFANYVDWNVYEATDYNQLTDKVLDFIGEIEEHTGVPVTLIGTGPRNHHIIDRRATHPRYANGYYMMGD